VLTPLRIIGLACGGKVDRFINSSDVSSWRVLVHLPNFTLRSALTHWITLLGWALSDLNGFFGISLLTIRSSSLNRLLSTSYLVSHPVRTHNAVAFRNDYSLAGLCTSSM
jgi:hypothetical protein